MFHFHTKIPLKTDACLPSDTTQTQTNQSQSARDSMWVGTSTSKFVHVSWNKIEADG